MEHNNKNEQELFDRLAPPFKKSKDEIWGELFASKMEEEPELEEEVAPSQNTKVKKEAKIVAFPWMRVISGVAAALFLGVFTFVYSYTTTISAGAGEQFSHQLPDGSSVELNAASSISYAPYWFWQSREVQLEGEAFFEVEKGSRFMVLSGKRSTEVLGTSFNIFARGEAYRVFCATGKVKVRGNGKEQELTPGQSVVIDKSKFELKKDVVLEQAADWKAKKFYFNGAPLNIILEEVGRHYGVTIQCKNAKLATDTFTGSYSRPKSVEGALELICGDDLQFVKLSEGVYEVK